MGILILDKILGFIKFSSNILLGNWISRKEAFPFSNTGLLSCFSHPTHSATVRLNLQDERKKSVRY